MTLQINDMKQRIDKEKSRGVKLKLMVQLHISLNTEDQVRKQNVSEYNLSAKEHSEIIPLPSLPCRMLCWMLWARRWPRSMAPAWMKG